MKYEYFTDEKGVERVRRIVAPDDYLSWAKVPLKLRSDAKTARKTAAVAIVERFMVHEDARLLVLSGDTGLGKSTAAAVALKQQRGIWVHAPELAKIQQDDDHPSLDALMCRAELLVLDDVGLEHSTSGYAQARITDVLEYREAHELRSIATTNLTAEAFTARYGRRIGSRLDGDPIGFQHIAGADLRTSPHWQERTEK